MKDTQAEILTIGDEILYGQITDTNSQWISSELDKIGIKIIRKTAVGDNEAHILEALDQATARADLILITGGLGPTNDDLTKPCLAKFFRCEMEIDPSALEQVQQLFDKIGRELTDLNIQQANLPTKCEPLRNRVGTAPGMWFSEENKVYVSMPGVPHEMKTMMNEQVLPRLSKVFDTPIIQHRLIKTVGKGESWLSELIAPWEKQLPSHLKLAYLPGLGEVKLRITGMGTNPSTLQQEIEGQIEHLKQYAGKYIYGYDSDTLPLVVGKLMRRYKVTIGCAESCSGGALAKAITSIPGSSEYFKGSIVAYDNQIKSSMLGVDPLVLKEHGAVSEQVVVEMVKGAQKHFKTNIAIATSGIAGPGGGTADKPVGTIWLAVARDNNIKTRKLSLFKDRGINIDLTVQIALNITRQTLLEMDGEKV